jgi:hypothetical protein
MIAGILLLVVGAMAVAEGSISWIWFGLIAWAAMWMLFGTRRRRRRMRWSAAMQPAPAMTNAPPYPVVPVRPPAPAAVPPPRTPSRLPAEVEAKVDRIRRKAAVLSQHADRFPIGSHDLYVVQHTASDYLPATVNAFLEVPAWSVETPTADGRTPLRMLHDQLDLLETKLDEIAGSVLKQRVDRLLANERFLTDRFGREERELVIPR